MAQEQQRYIQTNSPGMYRDTYTGAVINRNMAELNQITHERNRILQQEEINKKVSELSDAISDIKHMLSILMREKNGN